MPLRQKRSSPKKSPTLRMVRTNAVVPTRARFQSPQLRRMVRARFQSPQPRRRRQ